MEQTDNLVEIVTPKLCYICLGNLQEYTPEPNIPIKRCIRCGKDFCLGHSSKFEPEACCNCVSQIEIIDTVFEKTETDWDAKKDRLVTHTQRCRQIQLQGEDWVWNQKRISSLSDADLKLVIQYHKAVVSMIETELTERQVKKFQTNAVIPGQSGLSVTKTTQTKTTRTVKPKTPDLNALAEAIKKLGLTPEQLKAILGAAG